MRIESNSAATDIVGTTGEVREFSIEVNPVAFSLLSQKLYSHPIKAVIRELICNAYDAHVQAGTLSKPIVVGVPSSLMPEFTVTDYGTGLSDADVMRLYTTFFASNKRDSNSTIGGFGLGSKSPFAVADSFTVESRFNGVKSTYLATKDSGAPKLIRLASVPSTEHSGMTIRVPVTKHFNDWLIETKHFASTFDHPIEGIGNYENQYALGNNTYLHGCLFRTNENSNLVRVGKTVCYQVSFSDTFFSGCIIDLPIGSVTIAPNREELVLDENTKSVLRKREQEIYLAILSDISSLVGQDLDSRFSTPAEALNYVKDVCNQYLPERKRTLISKFTWGGVPLDPERVPHNRTNARLGKDFDQYTVPSSDVSFFKLKIRSNNYAHLEKLQSKDCYHELPNGDIRLINFPNLWQQKFDIDHNWLFGYSSYDTLVVVNDLTVPLEYKELRKRLCSSATAVNRQHHATTRSGLTIMVVPPYVVKEIGDIYWIKDVTTEPNLKDKVVYLSQLTPYAQPKQVRSGTTVKRTDFHQCVTVVGEEPTMANIELDYDTNAWGTTRMLFVPETYSSMPEYRKQTMKRLAAYADQPVVCFMEKARKAFDKANDFVKSKWVNLRDTAQVIEFVTLKFTDEIFNKSTLQNLPEYLLVLDEGDFNDPKLASLKNRLNTLSSTTVSNLDNFVYLLSMDVKNAVQIHLNNLKQRIRDSFADDLLEATQPYSKYLDSLTNSSKENLVNIINLVYNTTIKK